MLKSSKKHTAKLDILRFENKKLIKTSKVEK